MTLEKVDLRIREATELDLPALEWGGEYVRFRRVYKDAMKEVKKGRRVILIAETAENHVGQIFINYHSTWRDSLIGIRTGYLHSFRVKPAFRNLGIGRRLILAAERTLRQSAFQRAVISVAKANEGALRLYQTLGYEIIQEDPGEWSFRDHQGQIRFVSEPAFILRKSL